MLYSPKAQFKNFGNFFVQSFLNKGVARALFLSLLLFVLSYTLAEYLGRNTDSYFNNYCIALLLLFVLRFLIVVTNWGRVVEVSREGVESSVWGMGKVLVPPRKFVSLTIVEGHNTISLDYEKSGILRGSLRTFYKEGCLEESLRSILDDLPQLKECVFIQRTDLTKERYQLK